MELFVTDFVLLKLGLLCLIPPCHDAAQYHEGLTPNERGRRINDTIWHEPKQTAAAPHEG